MKTLACFALFLCLSCAHATEDPATGPEAQEYTLRAEQATSGTLIKHVIFSSRVPPGLPYEKMTAAQQALIRAQYQRMDDGDEPPYPLRGTEPIIRWLHAAQRKLKIAGELDMSVEIDRDGNPTSVTIYSSPDPAFTKVAALVVMKEKYKPARCAGEPCAMAFPFNAVYEKKVISHVKTFER